MRHAPVTVLNADPDQRDSTSPFGVLGFLDWNHDWNNHMYDSAKKLAQAISMMHDAGVGMVRQVISWDEVELSQNQFNFDKYDRIIAELDKNDVRMLGTLCYTATWTGQLWNSTPDTELFKKYVRATVERYKGRIKYWELWNEPDQKTYWADQDSMKSYVRLLKEVYDVIKSVDPTATVVLGSTNTPEPLRQMYQEGAKDYFDIVNVHPFVSPLFPDALNLVHEIYAGVRAVMVEFNDQGKPIWFTELGAPGVPDTDSAAGWWQGKAPNEAQQAEWVTLIYGEPLSWPGVQKIFWAFFQDSKHFGDSVDNFGLIQRDFTPKPSYEAYKKAASTYRHPGESRGPVLDSGVRRNDDK